MYICICNSITEKDIENIINTDPDDTFRSPVDILKLHNKIFKCNKCYKSFKDKMKEYYE